MQYYRDPCIMPYAAVGRWNPLELNVQLENAMNDQVLPDVSSCRKSFCALRAEMFPDCSESLLLSRDKNEPLLNGDTSSAEIRAVFTACSEGLIALLLYIDCSPDLGTNQPYSL